MGTYNDALRTLTQSGLSEDDARRMLAAVRTVSEFSTVLHGVSITYNGGDGYDIVTGSSGKGGRRGKR